IVQNGTVRKVQYWDVNPDHAIRYGSDAAYAEHFSQLFTEAVRCRLRSHGPVAALLSGGLDSSSIVCTAQKLYQEKSVADTGFEHLTDLLWQGKLRELCWQLRQDAITYGVAPMSLFVKYCLRPSVPGPVRVVVKPFLRLFRRKLAHPLIRPEFFKLSGLEDR